MDSENDLRTVGGRIRWAITKHLRIRQSEAARRLTIKPGQLSRWITDPNRQPNDESLGKIAELTGVPRAWLRYGGDLEEAGIVGAGHEEGRPDAESLLQEAALRAYTEFMGELYVAGYNQEAMDRAARIILAPLQAEPELLASRQVVVVQMLSAVARAAIGAPPGTGPSLEPGPEGESTSGAAASGRERELVGRLWHGVQERLRQQQGGETGTEESTPDERDQERPA